MNFLYPAFLFAAAAIALPIILHFFNLRPYKVLYFSNIALLRQLNKESRSNLRLKYWLVLALRVLAILALVVAFAYPVENQDNRLQNTQNTVGIYLDNSFSMQATSEDGVLFEIAKNKALTIVESSPENTSFLLITNDLKPEHQTLIDKKQIVAKLHDLELSPRALKFSQVTQTIRQQLGAQGRASLYAISDFQKAQTNIQGLKPDSLLDIFLLPMDVRQVNNLLIDSVWFENPSHLLNETETLKVQISNKTNEVQTDLPLSLQINNQLRASVNVNLAANESKVIDIVFANRTKGVNSALVSINDFPITFDNNFYFSFDVIEQINMLIINQQTESKLFDALGKSTNILRIDQKTALSISSTDLSSQNVVVLNRISSISESLASLLKNLVETGGTLIVLPTVSASEGVGYALNANLQLPLFEQIDTTKTEIDLEVLQNPMLKEGLERWDKNSEMPKVKNKWIVRSENFSDWQQILWDKFKNPLLLKKNIGQGKLYLSTFSIEKEYSTLSTHPLFMLVWLNIPIASLPQTKLYYTISKAEQLNLQLINASQYEILHLKKDEGNFSMVPTAYVNPQSRQLMLRLAGQLTQSGNYSLLDDENLLTKLSFNYDRVKTEQNYQAFDTEILASLNNLFAKVAIFEGSTTDILSGKLKNMASIEQFWRIILVFGFIFLMLEILVLLYWK